MIIEDQRSKLKINKNKVPLFYEFFSIFNWIRLALNIQLAQFLIKIINSVEKD